ncbi:hypothetical protein L3X38_003765 [Prunus dulcis]|uniref:Uncharacterized protein n=1 Tax=Prunus dulcis TaxID=3755 RepID=A0AAD4ZMP8_PRUDU|nr:hypothetical protein L3X38_003765 [Prunus dulcis]
MVTTHSARSGTSAPNAFSDGTESNLEPSHLIVSSSHRWRITRRASLDANFEDTTTPPSLPTRSRRRSSRNLYATDASFVLHNEHFSSASYKARYHDIVVHRPLLLEDDFSLSDLGLPSTTSSHNVAGLPWFKHSKVSWRAATILYSLQFGFFIPIERFLHKSLIAAGFGNASCPSASMVLPRIITSLAKFHGISTQPNDDIGCSNMIKVISQVSLNRSDAQCPDSGLTIPQQSLFTQLSVQHHETMALLRTFQDILENQSDMIAVLDTRLRSIEAYLRALPSG